MKYDEMKAPVPDVWVCRSSISCATCFLVFFSPIPLGKAAFIGLIFYPPPTVSYFRAASIISRVKALPLIASLPKATYLNNLSSFRKPLLRNRAKLSLFFLYAATKHLAITVFFSRHNEKVLKFFREVG